eukprot:scaffold10.g2280.t1
MDGSFLLTQLLSAARQGGAGSEATTAIAAGVSQLGLLSAAVRSESAAAEAADELVARAKALLGAKQAATKQLGLELLRRVIADCDRHTFLACHAEWAPLLLAHVAGAKGGGGSDARADAGDMARAGAPAAVQAAAWECLAALYERLPALLGVAGVRRDASSAASKLCAALLALPASPPPPQQQQQEQLQNISPALLHPAAQRALLAALAALPASFRQQQRALEPPLVALLLRAAAPRERDAAAALLASLPRIQGDADSWSQLAQRLLATAHSHLDAAYLSLDDRGLARAARAACDPGAPPLVPAPAPAAAAQQLLAVLDALQVLLTRSYPSAVPLPSAALLLLASRLLSVDDSAAAAAAAAGAAGRFAALCWCLPALHAAALRLLATLLAAGGAQLTPLFVAAARLAADHLERAAAAVAGASGSNGVAGGTLVAAAPAVRCALYAACRQLLLAGGAGVVRPLAPAVLAAASAELYGARRQQQEGGRGGEAGGELPSLPLEPARKKARKRKQQQQQQGGGPAAVGGGDPSIGAAPNDDLGSARQQGDLAAQAALLGLLACLLSQGAPLLGPADRAAADAMAAHAASAAAAGADAASGGAEAPAGGGRAGAELLLASHRALLASVLAPAPHRPRYLPAALALFQRGRVGACPQLAAFCAGALASCEALLHPRAAPPPAAAAATALPGAAPPPLGMPRFWSPALVGASASAGLGATQLVCQAGVDVCEDAEIADAEQKGALPQPAAVAAPQAAVAAVPQPAAAAPVAAAAAASPPAATALPAAAALAVAAVPRAAALFTTAAAAAAAAAAAEESDSEGSLPEIDSGASDSGGSSGDDAE